MQFLVICRPDAGGDPDEFSRLVPFETEAMREQKAAAPDRRVDPRSPGRHPHA